MDNNTTTMQNVLQPDKWVETYGDVLYAFAKSRVTSDAIAEDIVQDTFLSAWKGRHGYRGDASEKSWLFTICRNKITDHYRKASKNLEEHGISDYGMDYFNEAGHWTKEAMGVNWSADADSRVETKEFYKVLDDCKNNLKELQQAVFVYKYLDDMDADEICKELNITPSNYWVLMHRAKLQLRDCLGKNWFNK